MKKIIGGRGTGKSTELIRRSADTGNYIVVPTKRRANHLFKQAKDMGINIPYPVTWDEIKHGIDLTIRKRGSKMKNNVTSDVLLVGLDFSKGEDVGVLIVGRKRPNDSFEIINTFQGEEARWMYNRLITKDKDEGEKDE